MLKKLIIGFTPSGVPQFFVHLIIIHVLLILL